MSPDRKLLTTTEVAELLRVHPKHVYRLLKKGLPARRVGSEWRFDRRDVLVWSGGSRVPEAPPDVTAPAVRGGKEAPPSIVAVNGDIAVMTLLRLAAERGPPLLGHIEADKGVGLGYLALGAVLAAGAHAGGYPTHVGSERAARLHVVTRQVGLVSRKDSKPFRLKEIARLKLASRPTTAGVRQLLDGALRAERLDPEQIHRRAFILSSHFEVVLAVTAGRADVGLASRAWGERLGLAFLPLADETYGLIVKACDLGDERVVRLCEIAQSEQFRAQVGAIPGYDVEGAGEIRYDA